MIKKIFKILRICFFSLLVIVLLGFISFLIDNNRMLNNKKPLFTVYVCSYEVDEYFSCSYDRVILKKSIGLLHKTIELDCFDYVIVEDDDPNDPTNKVENKRVELVKKYYYCRPWFTRDY